MLVSSIGETSREAIGQFKKSIINVNGTILGCIVNKVDYSRKYGYGGYYRSYQKYGSYGLEEHTTKNSCRSVDGKVAGGSGREEEVPRSVSVQKW